MNDKQFVEKILAGNQSCWKDFVEKFTDWVLYAAWIFEQKFCDQPNRFNKCSLLFIMRERKGKNKRFQSNGENCDNGIELYIWLLSHLRSRLKSCRGEDNSKFTDVIRGYPALEVWQSR